MLYHMGVMSFNVTNSPTVCSIAYSNLQRGPQSSALPVLYEVNPPVTAAFHLHRASNLSQRHHAVKIGIAFCWYASSLLYVLIHGGISSVSVTGRSFYDQFLLGLLRAKPSVLTTAKRNHTDVLCGTGQILEQSVNALYVDDRDEWAWKLH